MDGGKGVAASFLVEIKELAFLCDGFIAVFGTQYAHQVLLND